MTNLNSGPRNMIVVSGFRLGEDSCGGGSCYMYTCGGGSCYMYTNSVNCKLRYIVSLHLSNTDERSTLATMKSS